MPDNSQTNSSDEKGNEQNPQPESKTPAAPLPNIPNNDSRVKKPDEEPANANASDQNEEKRQSILERSANLQAWCAIAIAVFTAAQVLVGYWQWRATDKQYDAMMEQLEVTKIAAMVQTRANVLVSDVVVPKVVAGEAIDAVIQARNSGQTPAYNLTMRACVKITDADFRGKHSLPEFSDRRSMAYALPDGFVRMTLPVTIPDNEVEAIMSGKRLLWIVGELQYIDQFTWKHKVRFSFVCPGTNGFSGGNLASADTGNEVTIDRPEGH